MKYYFAPMEGVTDHIYRNIHHKHFPGIDKYYTPFISVYPSFTLKNREKRGVMKENNRDIPLVPQFLVNEPQKFLYGVRLMQDYGWDEVNLNLGCPSGTVVSKGRGAGFLADPEKLEAFFESFFEELEAAQQGQPGMKISVKTRLGMESVDEFDRLLEIYNRFPIHELAIHPRLRTDYYKGPIHMDVFRKALAESRNPVCYNGDICTPADMKKLREKLMMDGDAGAPGAVAVAGDSGLAEMTSIGEELIEHESAAPCAVMIGRGLVTNPALVRELQGGEKLNRSELKAFSDELYDAYREEFEEKGLIFRMKELWGYMGASFDNCERYLKGIRKAQTPADLRAAITNLFGACELREDR